MSLQIPINFNIPLPSRQTPLSYLGGKKVLCPLIDSYAPSGLTEMVSPFIGGGSVELHFACLGVRVFGYDNFPPLVNFWQHILTVPSAVVDGTHKYQPVRDHYNELYDKYYDIECPLEQASAYWVLNKGSFNGHTLSSRGRHGVYRHGSDFFNAFHNFQSPRLSVSCADFRESLSRHPDTFAYCDPPYVGREHRYGDGKSKFPHEALADVLKSRRGDWLLSYHDDPLIRELYPTDEFLYKPVSWQYGGKSKYIGCQELLIMRAG